MGPHAPVARAVPAFLAIAALCCCAPPASAADPPLNEVARPDAAAPPPAAVDSSETPRYHLDPIVVTPGRLPLRQDRVPADVTVLDRAGLDAGHAPLLSDAFRDVPGLDVQRAGGIGTVTGVRLRGADPRHTLVLFDGVPLSGPWLGGFDFADLTSAGFGRAEIVGGPASSLYGSGAVGGVIHLLPDAGATTGSGLAAFAGYGGESTQREGVEWRRRSEELSAGAAFTHLASDGTAEERSGYSGVTGQVHADLRVRNADRLRVSALGTSAKKELPYDYVYWFSDSRVHQVLDPNNEEEDAVAAGRVAYTAALHPRASLEAEVSGLAGRIENRNEPSGDATDYQRTSLDNSRGTAALRARAGAGSRTQAVLGAEYRDEQVDRDDDSQFGGYGTPTHVRESVQSRAIYAQGHAETGGRLLADAGIRVEDHSRYGAFGVPRVMLGVAVPEAGLRLRGGYGRAFTAPTLSDLHFPGYGSPALRPERSTSWEAGLDGAWSGGRLAARLSWYTTDFHDLIQSNSLFVAENVGRARIEGAEVSLSGRPHRRLRVTAWAAHLDTENLGTGEPLPKRPTWRTGAGAEYVPAVGASVSAAWRWVDSSADPFDFVDATGKLLTGPLPEYAVLDLAAAVPFGHGIPGTLDLRLSNALDREYQEVKGYPAPGRMLVAGLTIRP